MEVNESASVLGEVTADMTRFLMHGCCDVGAICDASGEIRTFGVGDPCILLAVGDDEFAVVSQSGRREPQIIVFYISHEDPSRIGSARRAVATERNVSCVKSGLENTRKVDWGEIE